jgi:tetraacyldisaccharide 4'-kinase
LKMSLSSPLKTIALSLPAAGYYSVQRIREEAYRAGILESQAAGLPVVSVGNILLGGSGKTPFVIYLAEMLHGRGFRPVVVSRGYRGSYQARHLVVSDGRSGVPLVEPELCGDEPFLIARRLPYVPVLVGRRRIEPVTAAGLLFRPDLVILDDGFQHLPLQRDADIVLLNGTEDRMFPLGRLREPMSALKRADIAVLVGEDATVPEPAKQYLRDIPVFRCRQVPLSVETSEGSLPVDHYADRDVSLVSGIASPERFRHTANKLGWRVNEHLVFPDHYCLTETEIRDIHSRAGALPIVVTEKDWVKLPARVKESGRLAALRIGIVMDDEDAFWSRLVMRLPERRSSGDASPP